MKLLLAGMLLLGFTLANAQETMHIHTDKQLYLPGETIWFKAYLFSNGQPSSSTNLYAGLYNAEGNLLTQKRFPIIEGTANGEFKINDTTTADALQLFLFTKTMKRDSTGATHVVKIYNGKNKIISKPEPPASLNAIPEGGNLVAGIVNKLIIRSANSKEISGSLYETGSQQFIDSFQTNKEGVADLQFIPKTGSRYYILWSGSEKTNQEILLPLPLANGAILRTDIAGNTLYYSIQKNNNIDRFNKLHLSIHAGRELLYKESVTLLNSKGFVGNFKTDSFPSGILDVLLTDDNNNLLQKKKILINNTGVSINVIEKDLRPKGKNIIEVSVSDTFRHNMSLVITDAGFNTGISKSIYELLIPGTEITESLSGISAKHTDLVMNSTTISDVPVKAADDNYLSLYITMKDRKYAIPDNSILDLVINDKGSGKQFFNLTPVSRNGYNSDGLIFYDSAKVYYKVDNNKSLGEWMKAYVDDEISAPQKITALTIKEIKENFEYNISEAVVIDYSKKQAAFNDVQVLKTVVVKGKRANPVTRRLEEVDEKYSTGMFSGLSRGYQLNALDDPQAERAIDVFSYITYRIPGLQTAGTLGSRYIRNTSFRLGEPVLFINETESPREALESVTPSQLAYVKYIPGIVIGSAGTTADGALYVYTKRGDEPGERLPNMKEEFVKGYDMSREFRVADHSGANSSSEPDYRSTIYWNPYLFTDKDNRKIRITYYNNDLAKKHLLVLKGIAEDGSVVEIRKVIE